MRRVVRKVAQVAVVMGVGLVLGGCDDLPTAVAPAGKSTINSGQETSSSVTLPDNVWSVVQSKCVWCHTPQYAAANLDLTVRTQSLTDVRRIGEGVALELAPFITRLSTSDKQTILSWVAGQTGTLPAVQIPSMVHWELNPLLAGLPNGTPVPGFGFVIEDATIDPSCWTVATYTDRFGITSKSVALDQTHSVNQSIYSLSRNPSSYFVFGNLPFHGRYYDMQLEGDVRVDRWMSVGMQAEDMRPTGRGNRSYVRLQFDRDAISLRSAPTANETWPWGAPDGKLTGSLDASGFYQRNDEWLHFVFTATRISNGVRWTAVVTRRGTGVTVASLQGIQQTSAPLAGTFFLHAYAAGGRRNWANLVFDAKIDGATQSTPPHPRHPDRRRDRLNPPS